MRIQVEIRSTKGVSRHELTFPATAVTLQEVLVTLAQQEWGQELFEPGERPDRPKRLPGYLMVLENRMVQNWEAEAVAVMDGQHLKFVKVVPGG